MDMGALPETHDGSTIHQLALPDHKVGPIFLVETNGLLAQLLLTQGQKIPYSFKKEAGSIRSRTPLDSWLINYLTNAVPLPEWSDIAPHIHPNLWNRSTFDSDILRALTQVKHGESTTYADLAEAAGYPRTYARQVGRVVGSNPIPILLPCHRVLAAGAKLGGYSAGLEWKRFLLELESIPYREL